MMFRLIFVCLGMAPSFIMGSEDFWAFKSVQNPEAPVVGNSQWERENLDRFVLAGIEKGGYVPTEPAGKRVLVRRAYLDLHGLPPSTEQI